ncbi:cytochrome-c oxidase [Prolixibacteraceae bacterium JC049]|nr:cytochrome-c oxidase [Prolixibacteraceae bacterium JC049]
MENEKHHIVPIKTYVYILIGLIALTFISIGVTHIELGEFTTAGALILASLKSWLVLSYFMHLKFDNVILRIFVALIVLVFAAVVAITFMDYMYR